MPFPTLTFAEMLSNSTREELQQMLALFEGYLRVEHDDNGQHTDVHADSVTVEGDVEAGGDGTFDGNVTAQAATAAAKAILGDLGSTLAPGDPIKYGVLLGGETSGWLFYARPSGSPGTDGNELRLYDLTEQLGLPVSVLRLVYDAGNSRYLLGIESGSAVALGEDATAKRFEVLHTKSVSSLNGYFEHARSTRLGEWISVTHSGANFTASSGTWTVDAGDQTTFAYTLVGTTMTVSLSIVTTDVSATPLTLRVAIPGGFIATKAMRTLCQVLNAGTAGTGMLDVTASGTVINVYVDTTGVTNWATTAADDTYVIGQFTFEVQ